MTDVAGLQAQLVLEEPSLPRSQRLPRQLSPEDCSTVEKTGINRFDFVSAALTMCAIPYIQNQAIKLPDE